MGFIKKKNQNILSVTSLMNIGFLEHDNMIQRYEKCRVGRESAMASARQQDILYVHTIVDLFPAITVYINCSSFIKGSLDEKLPSYEVLKMLKE